MSIATKRIVDPMLQAGTLIELVQAFKLSSLILDGIQKDEQLVCLIENINYSISSSLTTFSRLTFYNNLLPSHQFKETT